MSTVLIGNQVVVRKFTIKEYYRMAEVGIIRPSERVELLNGRIIQIAPRSPRHQTIVDKLSEIFAEHTKCRYRVRVNGPIQISKFSEPEPDLVLYRRSLENKHPEPPTPSVSAIGVTVGAKPIGRNSRIPEFHCV